MTTPLIIITITVLISKVWTVAYTPGRHNAYITLSLALHCQCHAESLGLTILQPLSIVKSRRSITSNTGITTILLVLVYYLVISQQPTWLRHLFITVSKVWTTALWFRAWLHTSITSALPSFQQPPGWQVLPDRASSSTSLFRVSYHWHGYNVLLLLILIVRQEGCSDTQL